MARVNHEPLIIGLVNQNLQELFPYAFIAPTNEATMSIAPSTIIWGKVAPRCSIAHNPEHCIDKTTIILSYSPPASLATRQMWFE